ncbi:MAG: DUF1926 domain-containing protein [Treponema sp.]|nr:DUF1926 domain-containing protein [Treponema sp.]
MKEEKKVYLILGSHAHVPSGARESEFEYVYEKKMRPFISTMYRYSNIHAVLHYSGVLLYWVERNHPEFFMLIEDMVSRKQAEILGGGFYEPYFPLIPLQDRIGQIELMTTYLRKHFGKRPLGCWIPDFVWEQHMAASISSSDMNYTFLSREQFIKAGVSAAQLFSPCITEDQGKLVTVFPVFKSVEKELEEKSFSQVIVDFINQFEHHENEACVSSNCAYEKIISVFPDKVPSSPEEAPEYAWNRFFEEISLSKNIAETILPAKILKGQKIYNKCSFPDSSALDNNFSPRQFLIEHDEANGVYSKMIFTNVLINQLKGDKSRKLNAREELWKAQDSCLFSPCKGQPENELRKAAYSSLLRAEILTRDKGVFTSSLIQYDFDLDGIKEYLFQDTKVNCYIQLKGACVFELDYLPKEWNYLDCGSFESGRHAAFADIIASADLKITQSIDFKKDRERLCFNEYYEAAAQDRKGKSCFKLAAGKDDIPFGSIEINKCYLLKRDILTVSYTLKNTDKKKISFQFIPEINFSFAGISNDYVRFYTADKNKKDIHIDKHFKSDNIKILDVKNEVQINLASVKEYNGYLVPSYKNDLYQSTRLLPAFLISLESNETWTNEFSLKFSH